MTHSHPPAPLAHLHGERPPAPAWFTQALAQRPERSRFLHDGAQVELLSWGPVGAPGLLLLHGNSAHADWYSFIAPLLAERYRVAAMSFSGMGGSDWRAAYSVEQWSEEALAAAVQAQLFASATPPVVAGHSFGGFPLMTLAARHGQRLRAAVVIDTPMRAPADRDERERKRAERGFPAAKVYPSESAALMRFRFLPPQHCEHLFIVDHIARGSLKPVQGPAGQTGFSWRFDPALFEHFSFGKPHRDLGAARCPVVLVRGGRSRLITPELFQLARDLAPSGSTTHEVPDADHHVMVDQPLAFAELLRGLMAAP